MRALVDAALRLLGRSGPDGVTVTGVLEEASLSTRAFYRHFESRSALLLAVYADEQRRASRQLERRLAQCRTPREGLATWIDHHLGLAYEPAKRERTQLLALHGAQLRHEYPGEFDDIVAAVVGPLERVLRSAIDDGTFPGARPADDARAVHAVVWDIVERRIAGSTRLGRKAAADYVLGLFLPALREAR